MKNPSARTKDIKNRRRFPPSPIVSYDRCPSANDLAIRDMGFQLGVLLLPDAACEEIELFQIHKSEQRGDVRDQIGRDIQLRQIRQPAQRRDVGDLFGGNVQRLQICESAQRGEIACGRIADQIQFFETDELTQIEDTVREMR